MTGRNFSVRGKSCWDYSPKKLSPRTDRRRPVIRPLRADPTVRPFSTVAAEVTVGYGRSAGKVVRIARPRNFSRGRKKSDRSVGGFRPVYGFRTVRPSTGRSRRTEYNWKPNILRFPVVGLTTGNRRIFGFQLYGRSPRGLRSEPSNRVRPCLSRV